MLMQAVWLAVRRFGAASFLMPCLLLALAAAPTRALAAPKALFTAKPTSGTAPLTVQFTDFSSSEAIYWEWDFDGDGSTDDTDPNPSWTYTAPGDYDVILRVYDENSDYDEVTSSGLIHVSAPPPKLKAAFSAAPTSGTAPLSVQFTDRSAANPTRWAWDFDNDGTTDSTAQHPTWTYDREGTYSVQLTVGKGAESDKLLSANLIHIGAPPPPRAAVSIRVIPRQAAWVLSDAQGTTIAQGRGDAELNQIICGPLRVNWFAPAGYEAVGETSVTTQLTTAGLSLCEVFPLVGPPTYQQNARLLRYLLGVTTDSQGLDLNTDQTVDVADLARNIKTMLPTYPGAPKPVPGTTGVTWLPALDWSDSQNAASYKLYVWPASQGRPSTPKASGLTASAYTLSGTRLSYGAQYKWQVVAVNSAGQSEGPQWSFTTEPNPVTLVDPNKTMWLRGATVGISWKLKTAVAGTSVRFELWRNNAKVAQLGQVVTNASGQARTYVTLPTTLTAAKNYRLRVYSPKLEQAKDPQPYDESDGDIEIN